MHGRQTCKQYKSCDRTPGDIELFLTETQLVVKLRRIKPNCLYALEVIMLQ